jgi:hypothetical protein
MNKDELLIVLKKQINLDWKEEDSTGRQYIHLSATLSNLFNIRVLYYGESDTYSLQLLVKITGDNLDGISGYDQEFAVFARRYRKSLTECTYHLSEFLSKENISILSPRILQSAQKSDEYLTMVRAYFPGIAWLKTTSLPVCCRIISDDFTGFYIDIEITDLKNHPQFTGKIIIESSCICVYKCESMQLTKVLDKINAQLDVLANDILSVKGIKA